MKCNFKSTLSCEFVGGVHFDVKIIVYREILCRVCCFYHHFLRDLQNDNISSSGGYSNLGTRGKNFQKLMLSEKKKRSDLGLHIFLPKLRCSLKKKKEKKVFTQNRPLNKHLQRIQNCMCCFRGEALKIEGGLIRLTQYPLLISSNNNTCQQDSSGDNTSVCAQKDACSIPSILG